LKVRWQLERLLLTEPSIAVCPTPLNQSDQHPSDVCDPSFKQPEGLRVPKHCLAISKPVLPRDLRLWLPLQKHLLNLVAPSGVANLTCGPSETAADGRGGFRQQGAISPAKLFAGGLGCKMGAKLR
jgi:hypothetical protein